MSIVSIRPNPRPARRARLAHLVWLALAWTVRAVAAPLDPTDAVAASPDPAALESAARIAAGERSLRWHQEPTPAQLALDAVSYDLNIALDFAQQRVTGDVTGRFRVSAGEAAVVELDLAEDLAVSGVWVDGSAAAWLHADDRLMIMLARPYLQGEVLAARVVYAGTPPTTYGAFVFTQHNGLDHAYSFSEPFGARSWWPCDDWPADKADSVDLRVAVPHGTLVASNGRLRAVASGAVQDTFHWQVGYPIATYLVSVAVYPYALSTSAYVPAPGDTLPLVFYDFPDHAAAHAGLNARVPAMLDHFTTLFGPYPFAGEKYGHAEIASVGAIEHQTCTSIGIYTEEIIAHELAHQWWGDLVTCADFHHIWLNEGFATYAEALWLAHASGPQAYWNKMEANRFYGSGTIYVPDLGSWARIFDVNLSYHKAAWVVHMLRHVLGEDLFVPCLHAYRAAFAGGVATTEDLRDLAESTSGLELDDFFQQWIYGEYFPVYSYRWETVDLERELTLLLTIDQVQTNTGLFHMPIDVRVHLATGTAIDFVVDNAAAHETYELAVPAPVDYVEIDPDRWILRQIREPVEAPGLDQGTLLVNGLDWATYGQTLIDLYQQHAFWGNLAIDFWDCFAEPAGGYPAALPAPRGHGRVPSTVLGRYGNVIWLGNEYNGDLDCWRNTAVLPYLQAGGNLLLLAREGPHFLGEELRDYLGIQWTSDRIVNQCRAVHPLLTDIACTGTQNSCQLFATTLTQPTSTLLYVDPSYTPDQGAGVLRVPAGGGSHNPYGGRFAFLSGRPYRWAAGDLATNVETIVRELFVSGASAPEVDPAHPAGAAPRMLRAASPVGAAAAMRLELPVAARVRLQLFDTQGRLVATVLDGHLPAGVHPILWDGRSTSGHSVATGSYLAVLSHSGARCSQRIVLVR